MRSAVVGDTVISAVRVTSGSERSKKLARITQLVRGGAALRTQSDCV